MAGISRRIMQPILHAGARKAVLRNIDQPAPAIADFDIGKGGEDRGQRAAQDDAALRVRLLVGPRRESGAATEDKAPMSDDT